MSKKLFGMLLIVVFTLSSCVSYIDTGVLQSNYEHKINNTKFIGRVVFKKDKKKRAIYENVKIYLNEKDVEREFEVVSYAQFTPVSIPILLPEKKRIEKNYVYKAARKARKLKADGIIIDNKRDFRIIKFK